MTQRALGGRLAVALGLAGLLALPGAAAAQTSTREVQKDAESAGQKVEQGAERAGEKAKQAGQQAEQKTEPRSGSSEPLSDAWLTAKTKLALLADEDVSGTAINVDTSGGVVSLKGQVESQAEKAKAVEIARGIEGVKDVQDELTVAASQPGGAQQSGAAAPAKREDDQIADQVRQQIQESLPQFRADGDTLKGPQDTSITVKVDDGVVSLDGNVPDVRDIVKAAEAARRVQGVRSVKTTIESGQRS